MTSSGSYFDSSPTVLLYQNHRQHNRGSEHQLPESLLATGNTQWQPPPQLQIRLRLFRRRLSSTSLTSRLSLRWALSPAYHVLGSNSSTTPTRTPSTPLRPKPYNHQSVRNHTAALAIFLSLKTPPVFLNSSTMSQLGKTCASAKHCLSAIGMRHGL